MTNREKISIISKCAMMTDEQLVNYYHRALLVSLGSQVEDMYDLGYDMADIKEREDYEKYLVEKCDIIENMLQARGINPWEEEVR